MRIFLLYIKKNNLKEDIFVPRILVVFLPANFQVTDDDESQNIAYAC